MTDSARMRAIALPLAAILAALAVLGVQRAAGGGDFLPARAADPCAARSLPSASTGVEAIGEQLVLLGLDGAACRLGTSREALTLELAQPGPHTDEQVDALRAGLVDAADRMAGEGDLPKASALVDDALDGSDLPSLAKIAIRALPDALIDSMLKTDDVLRRAIQDLDLRALLGNLDDPDALTGQITGALTRAVRDALIDRLRALLP